MLSRSARCMASLKPRARVGQISGHLMSSAAGSSARKAAPSEPAVLFENKLSSRKFTLNRPKKLNALDEEMLDMLRPKIEEWNKSELCKVLIGTGNGRGFCAGGDVRGVIANAAKPETLTLAIQFFQKEFELDYTLAGLSKPYIAVMDGITMGGGVGLSMHAPFRIATENTVFAMPETKIGYFPDVSATWFLPRLDGEVGTYLGLTGTGVRGRAVFELGIATHFVSARRLPALLDSLASLSDPTDHIISQLIEESYAEGSSLSPSTNLVGPIRIALDSAFRQQTVPKIFAALEEFAASGDESVSAWAKKTLEDLNMRSPTSLTISLEALRRGEIMKLDEAFKMELNLASTILSGGSKDMQTGVTEVLINKTGQRPAWNPSTLSEINREEMIAKFFPKQLPENAPTLSLPSVGELQNPNRRALPSEEEIGLMVQGNHRASGMHSLTLEDLHAQFEGITSRKNGVKEKISEVVQRRCKVEKDGMLKWKRTV